MADNIRYDKIDDKVKRNVMERISLQAEDHKPMKKILHDFIKRAANGSFPATWSILAEEFQPKISMDKKLPLKEMYKKTEFKNDFIKHINDVKYKALELLNSAKIKDKQEKAVEFIIKELKNGEQITRE